MREDEVRFYNSLMRDLDNCVQTKRVALEGIEDERKVNLILRSQLDTLFYALYFVRSDEAKIVSIADFRTLREDIERSKGIVRYSDNTIKNLEALVRERDDEIAKIRLMMDKFLASVKRGVILDFGRDDGKR